MKKLRLGPPPRTVTVKVTVSLPLELKSDLDRYADLLKEESSGEPVSVAELIPHILQTFINRDPGFRARRKVPPEDSTGVNKTT